MSQKSHCIQLKEHERQRLCEIIETGNKTTTLAYASKLHDDFIKTYLDKVGNNEEKLLEFLMKLPEFGDSLGIVAMNNGFCPKGIFKGKFKQYCPK